MNNRESRLSLAGRTALVTGGSRGVGGATSKLLAARGANVIVNYFKNKDVADKVVEQLNKEARGTEGYAIAIQADVRKQTQVEYMVGEAIQRYGPIDILVNNAMVGRYFLKPFLETTWDDFLEKFNDEIKAGIRSNKSSLIGYGEAKLWSNYICRNRKCKISKSSWCNCFWYSKSRLGDICKIHSTRVWKKRNHSKHSIT